MMRQQIISAASGFSIETTPGSAAKVANFADHLAAGTTVNVTYLAGSDAAETIAVCQRLRDEGMRPVPHVAARNIESAGQLDDYLGALTGEAGVDEALVIAGGLDRPAGPYDLHHASA
jgi:methylenetetrahydrofolate reductase (NADPH)